MPGYFLPLAHPQTAPDEKSTFIVLPVMAHLDRPLRRRIHQDDQNRKPARQWFLWVVHIFQTGAPNQDIAPRGIADMSKGHRVFGVIPHVLA
jgi:hypothetical protein